MLAFLSFLSLIIWLVLVFAWGNFWRIWESAADGDSLAAPQQWPRVVAIVPARNEAASIAQVVSALARQDYAGNFSVIVVDDHSDDATVAIAQKSAQDSGAATKVQILSAPDLVSGWTGKLWALNAGVSAASNGNSGSGCPGVATSPEHSPLSASAHPEFFWFTDADVVHAP